MATTKFVFNTAAFVALRNSPQVVAMLQSRAQRIADAAGEGFATRPPEHGSGPKGRARVAVVTETAHAMNSEAKYRTLTTAVDAGR